MSPTTESPFPESINQIRVGVTLEGATRATLIPRGSISFVHKQRTTVPTATNGHWGNANNSQVCQSYITYVVRYLSTDSEKELGWNPFPFGFYPLSLSILVLNNKVRL